MNSMNNGLNNGLKSPSQDDNPQFMTVHYQDKFGNVKTDIRSPLDINNPKLAGSEYIATNGDVGVTIFGRD